MARFGSKDRVGILAIVLFVAVAVGLALLAVNIEGDGPQALPTIRVDGADRDAKRDDGLSLNEDAQDVLEEAREAPERFDLGGDLRGADSSPSGVLDGPLASQEWPGCTTAFVRSFSSRNGVVPTGLAYHYTAGANQPGTADLVGLTAYSNNPLNQVSWHFSIDREGNCFYNVPINHKAWTISALNSQTINIEVVGRGTDPDYAGGEGMKKLAAVSRRISEVAGIPLRLGAVSDCRVTRPGIITHWMGGPCSGGHIDIRPYDIAAVVARVAASQTIRCTNLRIEQRLSQKYRDLAIVADGRIGDRTRIAIRRLDRSLGFGDDGLLGPRAGLAIGLSNCNPPR